MPIRLRLTCEIDLSNGRAVSRGLLRNLNYLLAMERYIRRAHAKITNGLLR
jgi:hypothetical protein